MTVRPKPTARARRGFTLVELLAVMAIIMVLAGLGAFAVTRQMQSAKINEAKIKMSKIENAAKQYYIESGSQWPTVDQLVVSTEGGTPLLEGGAAAITDPWGGQFVGEPEPDAAGAERYVVRCTNPKTGQTITWPQQ